MPVRLFQPEFLQVKINRDRCVDCCKPFAQPCHIGILGNKALSLSFYHLRWARSSSSLCLNVVSSSFAVFSPMPLMPGGILSAASPVNAINSGTLSGQARIFLLHIHYQVCGLSGSYIFIFSSTSWSMSLSAVTIKTLDLFCFFFCNCADEVISLISRHLKNTGY